MRLLRPVGKGAVALLAGLAAASCESGTSPRAQPTPTHPAGTLATRVTVSGRPYGVAVSGAGTVYATRLDSASLARLDLPGTTVTGFAHVEAAPTDVVFDATGTTAYVTNQYSANVGVVNVATGTQVDSIPVGGGASPFRVLLSADGRTLYVSTNSGTVLAVDVASKAVVATYVLSGAINGLALHPTRPLLYATSVTTGYLFEINLTTGAIRALNIGGAPQDVAVSSDGTRIYVANETGPLDVRDDSTGAEIASVAAVTGGLGARLSPDGAVLYVTTPATGDLWLVNTSTLAAQAVSLGGIPRRIAFDRYGTTAVVTNETGEVDVIR